LPSRFKGRPGAAAVRPFPGCSRFSPGADRCKHYCLSVLIRGSNLSLSSLFRSIFFPNIPMMTSFSSFAFCTKFVGPCSKSTVKAKADPMKIVAQNNKRMKAMEMEDGLLLTQEQCHGK
jgi:hypothetical protein